MTTLEKTISDAFGLDDEGWARHANPLSGWTRFLTCLPLLVLAIWSRTWIGWWAAPAIALALLWIYVNPKIFPPVTSDRAWISRGVFGERLWTLRRQIDLPKGYGASLHFWNLVSLTGLPLLVWGLWTFDLPAAVLGTLIPILGKLIYLRRTAQLYDEAVRAQPELRLRPIHEAR